MSFDCKANLKPMKEWMEGQEEEKEGKKVCKPCMLAPVGQWYYNELKEQGHQDIADALEKTITEVEGTPEEQALTICQELDTIKESVEEPLRERLKDFDCAIQAFNPDDAVEETEDHAAAEK
jgi:bacterioferritin (cytochrome b1)